MQSLPFHYKVVTLFIFLMLFRTTTIAAKPLDSVETPLLQTITQIKNILTRHSSPHDIEKRINQAIEIGAKGLKLAYPPFYPTIKDMGWLVEDSKGREVFRVYFTFINNKANNGRYIGPLISNKAPKGTDLEILSKHRAALAKNLKRVSADKYDIGDGCIASLTLFKNSSAPGKTIITVDCH